MSQNADCNEGLTLEEIEGLMSLNDEQRDQYAVNILKDACPDRFDEFIELIRSYKIPHPVDIAIMHHHKGKSVDQMKRDFKSKVHIVESAWQNE